MNNQVKRVTINRVFLGHNSQVKFKETEDQCEFVFDASLGVRNYRALIVIMVIGFLLNLFGILAHYYLLEGGAFFLLSKRELLLAFLSLGTLFFGILLLSKLWLITRRCSWNVRLQKQTGDLLVLVPKGVGPIRRLDWRPKLMEVPSNRPGLIKEDLILLVASTEQDGQFIPLYSSLQPDFDIVSKTVLSLFPGQPDVIRASKKISCTGIVELRGG